MTPSPSPVKHICNRASRLQKVPRAQRVYHGAQRPQRSGKPSLAFAASTPRKSAKHSHRSRPAPTPTITPAGKTNKHPLFAPRGYKKSVERSELSEERSDPPFHPERLPKTPAVRASRLSNRRAQRVYHGAQRPQRSGKQIPCPVTPSTLPESPCIRAPRLSNRRAKRVYHGAQRPPAKRQTNPPAPSPLRLSRISLHSRLAVKRALNGSQALATAPDQKPPEATRELLSPRQKRPPP